MFKKIGLFILLCLFSFGVFTNVFAVTAEFKGVTRDNNRNILWVDITYTTQDGEVFDNSYPVAPHSIINKSQAEIQSWLVTNVKSQIDNYIAKEFFEDNTNLKAILDGFIGQKIIKKESIIEYDTNNDGIVDKTFTIKEDGTYVEVTP